MSYEFHGYEGYFGNPTPFYRHDSTPMPGNVLSQKERLMPAGQSSAALSCHQRNRKRKPGTGWEREGGRAEAAGFLKTGLTICMLPAKPTTLVTQDTGNGNETKRIPKTQCVSRRGSAARWDTLGGPRPIFDTWKLRNTSTSEGFSLRRILMCASQEQCVVKLVVDFACGQVMTSLFSQVWRFHVEQHGEVGAAGISGTAAGNNYTRY